MDCYVLDSGERVIGMQGMVDCIGVKDVGQVTNILALRGSVIDEGIVTRESLSFILRDSGSTARGISAHGFLAICRALFVAMARGQLATGREQESALHCAAILIACAEVGLAVLIDEATTAGGG